MNNDYSYPLIPNFQLLTPNFATERSWKGSKELFV